MAELKVGGEVDAFCTKCKMILAHTVLAIWASQIKRVRCNTCMGEHSFRAAEPGSSAPKASRPKPVRADKPSAAVSAVASSYGELLSGKDRSAARRYDVKAKFAVGELIEHPSFGLGVVAAARGLDKIDVAFPSTIKTLLHSKGSAPAAYARPPAPKRPDVETTADAADSSDEPEGIAS